MNGKNKIELKRNLKTGILEAWESGRKIGEIITMGDMIKKGGKNAAAN